MSYYAKFDGWFSVPSKEKEKAETLLKDLCIDHRIEKGGKDILDIAIQGYEKYHEENFRNIFTQLSCLRGKIDFVSEYDSLWRFVKSSDTGWVEQQGTVVYEDLIRYILVCSDGYSITSRKFSNIESARKALKEDYESHCPKEFDPTFKKYSFQYEDEALLYNNGIDVYSWKIIQVNL